MAASSSKHSPVLMALRAGTAAQHAALDRDVPLLQKHLTLVQYYRLLQHFKLIHERIEAALLPQAQALVQAGVSLQRTYTIEALQADLGVLSDSGIAAPKPHVSAHLAAAESLSEALGYLYVRQGATLGGQIIARHLAEHLPPPGEKSLRFFRGAGAQNGRNWRIFLAALTQHATTPAQIAEVVAAAQTLFTYFRQILTPLHIQLDSSAAAYDMSENAVQLRSVAEPSTVYRSAEE